MSYFINLAGLAGFEKYYPAQLSGGMGKRASIIRALAYEPPVILMDEPFGPLDAQTRMVLQDELLKIWEQKRQTIVFVTHDLVEAVALADRVVVMTHRPGKIKDVIKVPMAGRAIFSRFTARKVSTTPTPLVEYLSPRAQYRSALERLRCRRNRPRTSHLPSRRVPSPSLRFSVSSRGSASSRVRSPSSEAFFLLWEIASGRWIEPFLISSPSRILSR